MNEVVAFCVFVSVTLVLVHTVSVISQRKRKKAEEDWAIGHEIISGIIAGRLLHVRDLENGYIISWSPNANEQIGAMARELAGKSNVESKNQR